jgi:hypothetical protein
MHILTPGFRELLLPIKSKSAVKLQDFQALQKPFYKHVPMKQLNLIPLWTCLMLMVSRELAKRVHDACSSGSVFFFVA